MSADNFMALMPLLLVSATAMAVMIGIAIRRHHGATAVIALLGIAASLASIPRAALVPPQAMQLLIVDSGALLYLALLLAAAAFVLLFAYDYLEQRREHREEFYLLILLATAGSMVLVVSRHVASFFLGLELLSVALYALIAYIRTESRSIEAGIKYLILAAASSSVLLFGMALIYTESGSMDLAQLATLLPASASSANKVAPLVGLMMVLTGVGFKLAVAPFHLWTPDVYEGASLPVTAFIATVSKGGMFALLLRWFHVPDVGVWGIPGMVLSGIAIASMLAGNLLALRQSNVKRLLAYSSIAHMGYLLVALLAGGSLGASAATYYLIAYLATILGAFGLMTVLSAPGEEAAEIEDYRGMFWRRPLAAGTFTLMLLSLAGIPLTAGFLGKFYVLAAGASQSRWVLLFTLAVSSTIGLFYYLRVVVAMFTGMDEPERETAASLPFGATIALVALTGLVVLLGVYPRPLWELIRTVTRDLG